MNYESFVAHDMCIGTNACEVRDESCRRWRRGSEGEERAEKIPLRAKDSGWAELLHIIIIIITVVVVIIVVNGVSCYCERGRHGAGRCQSVSSSLLWRARFNAS